MIYNILIPFQDIGLMKKRTWMHLAVQVGFIATTVSRIDGMKETTPKRMETDTITLDPLNIEYHEGLPDCQAMTPTPLSLPFSIMSPSQSWPPSHHATPTENEEKAEACQFDPHQKRYLQDELSKQLRNLQQFHDDINGSLSQINATHEAIQQTETARRQSNPSDSSLQTIVEYALCFCACHPTFCLLSFFGCRYRWID